MTQHPEEVNKYVILKHLGQGHFSNVYLAQDRALNAEKAIKILDVPDPTLFLQMLEEAQILNKCRHKNIVQVNEANIYDVNGKPKVVIDMEFISGGSLENKLEKEFVSTIDAISCITDILFGLEYAHAQGVLHRDIKPANIMLSVSESKLSDFGLATSLSNNQIGSPKGYLTHLAPETINKKITSPVTDIFCVGITLFRTVCNISDWNARVNDSVADIYKALTKANLIKAITYPEYVPSKIKYIINKACNINPAKRYASASEMRQALEALRPRINWKPVSTKHWLGTEWATQHIYELELVSARYHTVIIKRNDRKITKLCKKFEGEDKATDYLYHFISSSTLK